MRDRSFAALRACPERSEGMTRLDLSVNEELSSSFEPCLNKLKWTSNVGADLSRPSPIYRPPSWPHYFVKVHKPKNERSSMMDIRVANAPCSWGALEFEGLEGEIAYGQMLDELRDSGYVGTELGDWGYMPTEPVALKEELQKRSRA